MSITTTILKLCNWLIRNQEPFIIDENYLDRYYLIPKNRVFNVYKHVFFGSDAPVFHNHPWYSFGIILDGEYIEHTPTGSHVRKKGDVAFRKPTTLHWIEIDKPVQTLFITGPNIHKWGFLCDGTIIDHEIYIESRGTDRLASGCGEYTVK